MKSELKNRQMFEGLEVTIHLTGDAIRLLFMPLRKSTNFHFANILLFYSAVDSARDKR